MFYRPHFCCHCGEKIVRAKWTPLTSRRFCDFCAVEQKQHDLLPRAAALIIVLFGAAGLAGYFSGSASNTSRAPTMAVNLRTTQKSIGPSPSTSIQPDARRPLELDAANAIAGSSQATSEQRASERKSSTEAVYYCGAMTKKGTACTRRVKIPGRCWQHPGQPAMSSSRN